MIAAISIWLISGCSDGTMPNRTIRTRLGQNMISNPGMENGNLSPDNWWTFNGNDADKDVFEMGWDNTRAHGGTKSLRIRNSGLTLNGQGRGGWSHAKFGGIDPSRTYLLRFWVSHKDTDSQQPNLWIGFSWYNNGSQVDAVQHYVDIRTTGGLWQEVRQTIARPDSIPPDMDVDELYFSIYLKQSESEIWIDDLSLCEMESGDMDLQTKYVYFPMPDLPTTDTPIQLPGLGRYSIEQDGNGRWWMVRPDGKTYFDISVDANCPSTITSPEHRSWIDAHYDNNPDRYILENVLPRCNKWGLTSQSAWSYISYYSRADSMHDSVIAHSLPETPIWQCLKFAEDIDDSFHVANSTGATLAGTHGMIDPYNSAATAQMQSQVDEYVTSDRNWILGYDVENETATAELVNFIWSQSCKSELANYLEETYGTIENLNSAWGDVSWSDFTELVNAMPQPGSYGERRYRDYIDFSAKMFGDFHIKARNMIRANDPDAKVLSTRFDFLPRDMAYIDALSSVDGVCIQWASCRGYLGPSPKAMYFINEIHDRLGKPTMISEWHVGAQDAGLYVPGSVNIRHDFVDTQEERALCYREMLYRLVSSPNVIGEAWFHFYEAVIFPGNNGFVHSSGPDIDLPYTEFVQSMTLTNARVAAVDPACRTWDGIYIPEEGDSDPRVSGQQMCTCSDLPGGAVLLGCVLMLAWISPRFKKSVNNK